MKDEIKPSLLEYLIVTALAITIVVLRLFGVRVTK